MKMEQSVPKRRHIKFRRRGTNQKKEYSIRNTAKVLLIQFSYIPARDEYKWCFVRTTVRTFHFGNVLSARKLQSKSTELHPVFIAHRNLFCYQMSYFFTQGALVGSVVSLLIMGWIVFGAQMSYADGTLKFPKLPTSTEGCTFNVTIPEPIA